MVAYRSEFIRVADLMKQQQLGVDALVESTGVERRVVEAIACQRYTPSPDQRARVCTVFGVDRDRVIWGHATAVEPFIHQPV